MKGPAIKSSTGTPASIVQYGPVPYSADQDAAPGALLGVTPWNRKVNG